MERFNRIPGGMSGLKDKEFIEEKEADKNTKLRTQGTRTSIVNVSKTPGQSITIIVLDPLYLVH